MAARRLARWTAVLGIAVGLALTGGAALAAPGSGASVTGMELTGDTLTGVLTVRSDTGTAAVDTTSLQLVVGDATYALKVDRSVAERRVTMLVVDTSGSMQDDGMAAVRASVASFLSLVPADVQVGVVSFADRAVVDLAPTTDRAAVQRTVDKLKSRGETSLYDGMTKAISALGVSGERSIVLLSDGGDTASRTSSRSVTAALKAKGVRAEVVGFGTSESDTTVLSAFATAGGGSVASGDDAKSVDNAFSAAARALDSQVTFSVDLPENANGKLTLAGLASGVPFTATADLAQARIVAAPVPTPTATATPQTTTVAATQATGLTVTGGPRWRGVPVLLAGGLGALFIGLVIGLITVMAPMLRGRRHQRVESIEWYVNPSKAAAAAASSNAGSTSASSLSTSLVGMGDKVMAGRDSTTRTMALIERADLPLRAGEWWVMRLVGVVVGIAASLLLLPGGALGRLIAALIGVVLGLVLPAFALRFLAKRRSRAFDHQLPDVLMLVASSLSSGFSLLQALDAVARDAADPVAKEFSRALAESRLGTDIADTLDTMAARVGSENMKWAAMSVRIQRQVGGNLAENLRTTAGTLRERESLVRQVQALSAEGKLSAYILIGLPIGVFLYMTRVNHAYVELLWTRPIGIAMLAGGLVMMGIGAAWMRQVVNVEV